jgi:hypothetical protein
MSIGQRTIGELFDLLSICNVKLYMKQEIIMNSNSTTEEISKAAVESQTLNRRRTDLVREIDSFFNQLDSSYTKKTY